MSSQESSTTSNLGDKSKLEFLELEQRVAKLRLENSDLARSHWKRPAVVIPIIGTALAAGVTLYTGTLDVQKRKNELEVLRLEEKEFRLTKKVSELEAKESDLVRALAGKTNEVSALQRTADGLERDIQRAEALLESTRTELARKGVEADAFRRSVQDTYPAYRREVVTSVVDRFLRECLAPHQSSRAWSTPATRPAASAAPQSAQGLNPFATPLLTADSLATMASCISSFDHASTLTATLRPTDRAKFRQTWMAMQAPILEDLTSLLESVRRDGEGAQLPQRMEPTAEEKRSNWFLKYEAPQIFGRPNASKSDRQIDRLVTQSIAFVQKQVRAWAEARARDA
jgi:hypothetical protein